APGATLDSLSVLNATPVAGVADQFVVPRNSPGGQVIINANVTNPPPGGLDSDALKWKGGTAGTNTQQRLVKVGSSGEFAITATLNGVTNTIRVFIVNTPAAPPAASSALLQHIFLGAANPGGDFGLTVVTIGQQGVKGPEFVINPFLNGDHWEFRVADIKHRYKLGVSSGAGRKDISGPRDADIKPSTVCNVITDLTPPAAGTPSGPPRSIFWSKAITTLHEKAHVDRFYSAPFWEAQMRLFEAFVSGITVPFTSALQSPAAALKDQQVNFKTQADTLHGAADALEIAGAEVAAHGVSNPLYTQLIADITNVAAPPAPTGLNASAVTQNSVTLGWNQDSCIETGFAIERRTNGRGAFVPAGNTATGTLSLTDAGLAADTKLQYRVRATGAGRNSSFSTVINVHTLP
ncbi:MAG: fibronectin type III domain-containing protein, partial [Ferruginibacter sp.]